jgi:penicillin-binding protein 1C
MIQAARSTGSILKPFLLASLLDQGQLLPHALVPDIPVQISGFVPQNYDPHFDGAVPADRALARSLNIPAVLELQQFGVHPFYARLKNDFKMTTLNQHPDHYGLSLILGGAECTLWDLARIYAGWAQTLTCYTSFKKYPKSPYAPLIWEKAKSNLPSATTKQKPILSVGSLYATLQAMQEVNRPEGDEAWRYFDSSLPISWKTGTSFGNRDAWAVGISSDYVVAVWVGNASGEGRPELTGVGYAAPLLFDVFRSLPRSKPFEAPTDDMENVRVCTQSGFLAQAICPQKTERVPKKGNQSAVCPYHKWTHLDVSKQWRVNSSCVSPSEMINQSWFVLPPVMAYYFQNNHADYRSLPPWLAGCNQDENQFFDFIYPKTNGKIYLTRNQEGQFQAFVCKVACSERKSTLFWYLDRKFLGQTTDFHELPIQAPTGNHRLVVVHENGQEIHRTIEIIRD